MVGFIDWMEDKLSLYIFEKKGSQYTLKDTLTVHLDGELTQSSLSPLLKTNIEHVYLSLPINLLTLRELSFPFPDKNKIKDTISYELEGILLGNTNDYSIDYHVKESSESSSRVLAVCIEKTKLRDIIDLFLSAGLEPVAITSLDVKLFEKNLEMLFSAPSPGEEIRVEAAKEDLVNMSVNLRQGELGYKGNIERIKKFLRTTAILLFLLFLILGADTTIKLISLKKENAIVRGKINSIYHNAFPEDTKIVDAARQLKGNLNLLREKKAILGGIPILDILLNISKTDNNIILNELNLDEKNIILKGTAPSFENVDEFKNSLALLFTDVKVLDSKALSDKKISFAIIIRGKTT